MSDCEHKRTASVSAKCSDMCNVRFSETNVEHEGYVPSGLGIGGGDYVEFKYCLDCGKIDGKFPVTVKVEELEEW